MQLQRPNKVLGESAFDHAAILGLIQLVLCVVYGRAGKEGLLSALSRS